ncbi:hypothetical protein GGTG_06217 [Gaeumannomyces tritici R3-111a-1]|uniref:Uncharacterized protein n=1 Tax=Gaeumannomyces tritici (strain R3-111a-1) TaxID=644352 RepID=J3NY64_GAET3|nr:hypothetical protein GGTG_06217 [Gaeumannomyces tritici R3-111a-1]EJT76297.1 hypothetical protein GGTG_06217 [Gaeumannomyces tritici R3-111a-1]
MLYIYNLIYIIYCLLNTTLRFKYIFYFLFFYTLNIKEINKIKIKMYIKTS